MVNLIQIFKKDANTLPSRTRVRDNALELEEVLGSTRPEKKQYPALGLILTFVSCYWLCIEEIYGIESSLMASKSTPAVTMRLADK